MTPLRALAAWLLLLVVAFANGTVRVLAYPRALSDFAARQVAAVVGAVALGIAIWFLVRRWPPARPAHAWATGALWAVLTILFEISMVRGSGKPWSDVVEQYALWRGSLWPLLLLWILAAPAVLTALQRRRSRLPP